MVDALRGDFVVSIPGPGENPLRAVRRLRPIVVLLAVPRNRSGEAVRTCRLIKTDSSAPPLVGLLDPRGRIRRPERTLPTALADGYLGGRVQAGELLEFTRALLAGERPVTSLQAPRGLLKRLLR